jgi:hypothetical protein
MRPRTGPATAKGRPTPPAGGLASITLTGRGGIAVIFMVELAARLLATVLGLGPVPGILFVVACVAATVMTRRSDQLTLVVSPPLIFFAVTLIAEFLKALGDKSVPQSTAAGLILALASDAPWLFLGTVLVIGIAMTRGLPDNIADLRRRLAATPKPTPRQRPASKPRSTGRRPAADNFDEDPVRWDVAP